MGSEGNGPPKKKIKNSYAVNSDGVGGFGQSTHSVEEDGYGRHMHATVSSSTGHVCGTVKGSIRRKYWINLDFSSLSETESYVVPYQFFHWWTGAAHAGAESNNSRTAFNKLVVNDLVIGGYYTNFKCRITNQATTRKRLLTQGSTTTVTHDFETSQNLMLVWDRCNDGGFDIPVDNVDDFAYKVAMNPQGTVKSGDYPFDFEELATGHTKEFTYVPPKLPNGMYWEPVIIGDQEKADVGKYVPSFTGYKGVAGKEITNNFQIYANHIGNYVNTFDRKCHTAMPGLFLTQPQIPSESGAMKFIYRLCVEFEVDYTMYMLSRSSFDGTYDRDCVMLPVSEKYGTDKKNVYLVTVPYNGYV